MSLGRCRNRSRRWLMLACAGAASVSFSALAGQFSFTKTVDANIDTAAWMANTSAAYGRAMNGNCFETETIGTYLGFQYAAFWKNVSNIGRIAVARRAIGSSSWAVATLNSASFI